MQTAISGQSEPLNSSSKRANPYETERLLNEYLLFHYGTAEENLPYAFGPAGALGFPVRCVSECIDLARASGGRALDLGCAVGRASFELSKNCGEVVGVDFSQRFVDAAEAIRVQQKLPYFRADEGRLVTPLIAGLPEGSNPDRVHFEQGDAMNLRSNLGRFDVVLMANLIDRLEDPMGCLQRLPDLVKGGGQLVITSPYTWMPEYTPEKAWLGGIVDGTERRSTLDGLKSALNGHFELTGVRDLPFLIREHARKFQWSVAQASMWRRTNS